MIIDQLKSRYPKVYQFLRELKRLLQPLALPDSSAMLSSTQRGVRQEITPLLSDQIPLLDIGAGCRGVGRAIKMDIGHSTDLDLVGDAHHLPFRQESIGCVWMGGVIEHIERPVEVANEIARVLKKKGLVYIETPFFQRVHAAPCDFQRFTQEGLRRLFERNGFRTVKSGVIAGPSAACSHVLRTYMSLLFSFNNENIFHVLYYYVFGWIFFPVKFFDFFLIRHAQSDLMAFGIYYLGQK